MATSKVMAKRKAAKNIERLTKMELKNQEPGSQANNSDLSQLRKPIDINLSSLRQVAKIFNKGTVEVQDILTYECDIIYECKICRSLFRSLANLISHKRVYCPQKFAACYNVNRDNEKTLVVVDDKENCSNDEIIISGSTTKAPKKDLTSVVDMLVRRSRTNDGHCQNIWATRRTNGDKTAYRQVIEPKFPAGGNGGDPTKSQSKNMSNGVKPAVYNVYSSNDDLNSDRNVQTPKPMDDLTCATCYRTFLTKRTLTLHMKYKHSPHRTGFPCPCCTNVFRAYRNLFKVHRNTNEQVRKLRMAIRRDDSRPEGMEDQRYEITEKTNSTVVRKRRKDLKVDILATDSQKGMIQGRRRKANSAGKRLCQRVEKVDGNDSATQLPGVADEINSYNNNGNNLRRRRYRRSCCPPTTASSSTSNSDKSIQLAIRVGHVSSLSQEVWDMIGTDKKSVYEKTNNLSTKISSTESLPVFITAGDDLHTIDATSPDKRSLVYDNRDVPEVIYTSIDNCKPVGLSALETESKLGIQYRGIKLPTVTLEKIDVARNGVVKLSDNLDEKPSSLANFKNLQCLPCNRKFVSLTVLKRHIAIHMKRNYYRCKLCDFKAFLKGDCIAHCSEKHDARYHRARSLIIEVPTADHNSTLANNTTIDTKKNQQFDVSTKMTKKKRSITGSTRKFTEFKRNLNKKKMKNKRTEKFLQSSITATMLNQRSSSCSNEIIGMKNLSERSCAKSITAVADGARSDQVHLRSTIDNDPELRKMVMEVIFGPAEDQINDNVLINTNIENNATTEYI